MAAASVVSHCTVKSQCSLISDSLPQEQIIIIIINKK